MKAVKIIGIIVLIVVGLFVGVGLILPSKVEVQRNGVIPAPREVVFEEVNNLRNWEDWSPWHRIDTTMGLNYEGEKGVGAGYSWTSEHEDVGNGRLQIVESQPFERIKTKMEFIDGDDIYPSDIEYIFEDVPDGTKTTWTMRADMGKNPFGKWMGVFMDGMVGRDFEKGIKNMEVSARNRIGTYLYTRATQRVRLAERKVVTVKLECPSSEISQNLGEAYGQLEKFAVENGLQLKSFPFAIYHSYTISAVSMEAGLEVNGTIESIDGIESKVIPATNAVMLDHFGPYKDTEKAHATLDRYIEDNGLQVTGSPWEVYVTDPTTEPDQAKWLTKVYYPIN